MPLKSRPVRQLGVLLPIRQLPARAARVVAVCGATGGASSGTHTSQPGGLLGSPARARAVGTCCRQHGGEGSSEPRSGDRGAQQQQARSHVRAVGVDGEVWAEPGTGMGWRHSVPLALSALPIDRGGAQGAVGVNNRPKPKPAAPKGGTGPPGLSEASGLVLRRVRRVAAVCAGLAQERRGGGEARRALQI